MAVITAHLEWPAVPGSLGYLIEYKEQSSAVWLTPGPPTNPANPTLNLSYDLEIMEDIIYDLRLSSQCSEGTTKYKFATLLLVAGFGRIGALAPTRYNTGYHVHEPVFCTSQYSWYSWFS